MIAELLVGGLLLTAAVSGWIAAYVARGQANDASATARLAEASREAHRARADDAEAQKQIAISQRRVSDERAASFESELARERKERRDLLESLAKSGSPVGPGLVDDTLDRLYENQDRRETGRGASPGPGRDPIAVPGQPPGAPATPGAKR